MQSSNVSRRDSTKNLRRALALELATRNQDNPHAWHLAHRSIRGEMPARLPAVVGIMQDRHPLIAIQKSAQAGVSEALTSLALWAVDTMYAGRGHVLYVMPTQSQMEDFTQSRIDPAIQESAYLRRRLQPEPPARKGADSKRLKHLGDGYLYLRASESRRQLTSVDADIVILDEYDFMPDETLKWAESRLASSRERQLIVASTPTYPEAGVNALFLRSDQRRYFISCPACSHEQTLAWPENVDVDTARVICNACRAPLDPLRAGRWIATAPGNARTHGYHLNRLYSPWANIPALIEASDAFTYDEQQQFLNFDLGEVFRPPGGGVSADDLDKARGDYRLDEYAGQPCVMGVDVGKLLHVVIRERLDEQVKGARTGKLWFAGTVTSFTELGALSERFNVEVSVIDALPETRQARDFQDRGEGRWLAQYDRREGDAEWDFDGVVHLVRTDILDEVFERLRQGYSPLPREARQLGGRMKEGMGEYYREVLIPQRTLVPDSNGNRVAKWIDGGRDDHFAHAEGYCLVAGKRHLYGEAWDEGGDEADQYEPPSFKGLFGMTF